MITLVRFRSSWAVAQVSSWRRLSALTLVPVLAAVFALALLAAGCKSTPPAPPLDVLGAVPDFSFQDQTGKTVSAEDLRGRVVVANFIFTRCPTVCPVTSRKMQLLGEKLAKISPKTLLVSFSVDPEHDTPEVLAAFAAKFGATPDRWRFLTGPSDQVRDAVESGFKLHVENKGTFDDGTPDIVHDLHFVLIDDQLRIRDYYDSDDPKRLDDLVRDAKRLLAGEG